MTFKWTICLLVAAILTFGCSANSARGFATPPPKPTPSPASPSSTPTPKPAPIPTVTPTPSPGNIVVSKEYYGTTSTGILLNWTSYYPAGAKRPAILLLHIGGFRGGSPDVLATEARDLATAGFWAIAIEYRLAPPHQPMNPRQTDARDDGHYPEQTADVKMAILRARKDARCNGKVGAVGGSAGGSHAVFCAATGTKGADKLDAAVALSGAYDFHDASSLSPPSEPNFAQDVYNYVNSHDTSVNGALDNASPYKQIKADTSPIYVIASDNDPMPPAQYNIITARLKTMGVVSYQQLLRPNSNQHAFGYWDEVKTGVISFLNRTLAVSTPTATPSPTVTPTPTSTPTATASPTSTPVAVLAYPKGIWSLYGKQTTISQALVDNKGVVGVVIGEDWSTVNPAPGSFVWTSLDSKVSQAGLAGFKIVLNIVNSSLKTPAWLLADASVVKIPLLDPAPGHQDTYCTIFQSPLFWDAAFHKARKDLAVAAGAHYTSNRNIIGVTIGFANYHSNDFNFADTVGMVQCPSGSQVLDQPKQWIDAGFEEAKMGMVGEELLDAYAAAFPNQFLKVPIGGLAAPALLTDYSQLARDLDARIFGGTKTYANRVSFQRNTLAADWQPGTTWDGNPPGLDSDNYIKYMVRKHATGTFRLAGLQSIEQATGGASNCRQGGGPNGPCGSSCPEACVMQKSLDVVQTFGVPYYEIFVGDSKNPSLYDMIKAATIAMGGTPRP